MKRISLWVLSTISAVVLLFSYSTSTGATITAGTSIHAQQPVVSSSSTSSDGGPTPTPSPSSGATAASSTTVTGEVASTRWGPVQVELTLVAGKIKKVSVLQYPSGNGRDQEINSYALPILTQETIDAQSSSIDMVSGATVTSDGYVQSLQSALDQAAL
jgi:uncharacterized protein with FMN-binding domain